MYDELIKLLRELHPEEFGDAWDFAFACQQAMCEAANAIESVSKAYQMMAEAYESEVTKPRWIPVTDRLPEPYTWVLVFAEDNKVAFDAFYDGDQWKDAVLKGLIVTHWMPLPEPPESGDK